MCQDLMTIKSRELILATRLPPCCNKIITVSSEACDKS